MSGLPFGVVFGAAGIGDEKKFNTIDHIAPFFEALDRQGIKTIDTAQLYNNSETYLGQVKAADKYAFDTKWLAGWKSGAAAKDTVVKSAKESVAKLGVKQVDIFYLHAPDRSTPLEDTLEGVNEVYKLGIFKRFGLSNYSPQEVQDVFDIAKSKGWVLPTVYQGNYSAVARIPEAELFPVLRKLNIAFYAYSPLAGGLLTKTADDIKGGAGRFSAGSLYDGLYNKPSYLSALSKWEQIAKDEGISRAELGFRWVGFNSAIDPSKGDALVIGASRPEQLESTVEALRKGKLSDKAAKAVEAVWEDVKGEAPVDNFTK